MNILDNFKSPLFVCIRLMSNVLCKPQSPESGSGPNFNGSGLVLWIKDNGTSDIISLKTKKKALEFICNIHSKELKIPVVLVTEPWIRNFARDRMLTTAIVPYCSLYMCLLIELYLKGPILIILYEYFDVLRYVIKTLMKP